MSVENVPLSAGTSLSAPVPNPTREGTEIRFVVSRTTHVTLGVYDAAGRRVAIPFEGLSAAGEHRVNWDARAASGAPVVPGVYFLRMEADGRSMTRRLVVVR